LDDIGEAELTAFEWAFAAGLLVVGIATSVMLAIAGEPQSFWLWHDVLGVI
jgi:hypothetical protein